MSNQVDALNVKINLNVTGQNSLNQANNSLNDTSDSLVSIYKALQAVRGINLVSLLQPIFQGRPELARLQNSLKEINSITSQLGENIANYTSYISEAKQEIDAFSNIDSPLAQLINNLELASEEGTITPEGEQKLIELDTAYDNIKEQISVYTDALKANNAQLDINNKKAAELNKTIAGQKVVNAISTITIIAAALSAVYKLLKAIVDKIIEASDWAKNIKSEAAQAFMSVEMYQKWGYVLDFLGTKFEYLKVAMRAMQQDSNIEYMKQLGIYTGSNEQNFENAIKYVQSLGTELEKTAAATKLFGRASDNLAAVYLNSEESIDALIEKAKLLGQVYSQETIDRMSYLADDINDLKLAWNSLTRNLAATFIPALEEIVHKLLQVVVALNNAFSTFYSASDSAKKNIDATTQASEELKRSLAGFDELELLDTATDDTSSSDDETGLTIFTDSDIEHIKKLTDSLSNISASLEPLTKLLSDLVNNDSGFWSVESILQQLDALISPITTALELFKPEITAIGNGIATLVDIVAIIVTSVLALIKGIRTGDWSGFEAVIPLFEDIISRFDDSMQALFKSVGVDIEDTTPTPNNLQPTDWNQITPTVEFEDVVIPDSLTKDIDIINKAIEKSAEETKKAAEEAKKAQLSINKKSINSDKMYTLASGGVAYKPAIAQIGEYAGASSNPEIVSPQSVMLETMNAANGEVVSALIQCTRQLLSGMEDNRTVVSIGDDQIAKAAARGNNSYKKQTGYSLI